MNRKARLTCIAVALAMAGTAATADAAKPLTPKERAAKAQELRQNHRNFQQPRTIAQAEARLMPLAGGGTSIAAPTELWNHLSVTRDANGELQVVESEGHQAPSAREATHD